MSTPTGNETHVVILGDREHGLGEDLASLLRDAGMRTSMYDVGDESEHDHESRTDALTVADVAIDLYVRDRSRKANALRLIDSHLAADRPLLTCCHAGSATTAAAATKHSGRVTGFALLPPWTGRTTVECAKAMQTADTAREAVEAFWQAAGLDPVWVGDGAGLVLPRVVACLANEAAFAVMEGAATAEDVDRAMTLGTRYPRGPLAWANIIGLPDIVATMDGLAAEHGEDRYRVAPLLRRMAVAGRKWEL